MCNQIKCPLTDKKINKIWYSFKMEQQSAPKKNGVLIHATTWMKLENAMLSQGDQTQKATYYMISDI